MSSFRVSVVKLMGSRWEIIAYNRGTGMVELLRPSQVADASATAPFSDNLLRRLV